MILTIVHKQISRSCEHSKRQRLYFYKRHILSGWLQTLPHPSLVCPWWFTSRYGHLMSDTSLWTDCYWGTLSVDLYKLPLLCVMGIKRTSSGINKANSFHSHKFRSLWQQQTSPWDDNRKLPSHKLQQRSPSSSQAVIKICFSPLLSLQRYTKLRHPHKLSILS